MVEALRLTPFGIFQVLFGPESGGGDSGPWHAQTGDGQGLQQLPKQNGEDMKENIPMYTLCSLYDLMMT